MWGMMIKTRQVLVQCTVPCHRLPLLNSTGLDQPAPLNDLKLMSAAFFSETNVLLQHSPGNGDRMFPSVITRSSILQNNNSWQLCFARSFRQSTQTLLQTARTEVEGMHFFPLEEQDVQRARAWLPATKCSTLKKVTHEEVQSNDAELAAISSNLHVGDRAGIVSSCRSPKVCAIKSVGVLL